MQGVGSRREGGGGRRGERRGRKGRGGEGRGGDRSGHTEQARDWLARVRVSLTSSEMKIHTYCM